MKYEESCSKTPVFDRQRKKTQYFSIVFSCPKPPNLASSTGPVHVTCGEHNKINGFMYILFENVKKTCVSQCFATPESEYKQNGRRAGEEVWQPSGGQPRIQFSGSPFLLAFRCGGVPNKNWISDARCPIGLIKPVTASRDPIQIKGADHPGKPPSLTRASHHGTRLGSAPVLRATGLEVPWDGACCRTGAPGERPGLP